MIIYGKNPVGEAVKAGKTIDKLYILREESDARMSALVKTAKERGAVVVNADRRQLDKLTDGGNHQGIAAQVTDFEYCSVEDILAEAESRGEKPLIVLADGITDPHNLGAILRSAECLGAHGVIIPQRRSVSVERRVPGRARRHHPAAQERVRERHRRQILERRGGICQGRESGQSQRRDQAAQIARSVGLCVRFRR